MKVNNKLLVFAVIFAALIHGLVPPEESHLVTVSDEVWRRFRGETSKIIKLQKNIFL